MCFKTIIFFFVVLFCGILCFLVGKVDSIESSKREILLKSPSPTNKETKTWNCDAVKACDDKLGFDAILTLHQRLDDDADGNIDIVESDEFLRDELNYKSGYERQKRFHRNDKQISVDELWFSWKSSEVHNWTVEETVQWLVSYVELPQYTEIFQERVVDGTSLPRLAVNNMHFLSNLGIKDPIHKHKISLKAMDVVLFGPPRNHNYFKDAVLALSVCIATAGCWFAFVQHIKSQEQLQKTMKDMESLQRAEQSLQKLQEELDKAKIEQEIATTEKRNLERRLQDEKTTAKLLHQDSSGNLLGAQGKVQRLEQELRDVIEDLRSAERALHAKNWLPSPALQHWLQLTHEMELQHYNDKKAAAEKQLIGAKEGCEKLRKKRTSFMGAFRVAHGNAIDDVDNRILQARTALSEVTKDLQERLGRWKEIEALCGFSIVHNPGIRHLEALLGTVMATTPTSATTGIGRRNSEETIADEDAVSIVDSGVSARSLANIPVFCNQRSGYSFNLGSMKSIPSADLKTVASSNAILQRSNAFQLDAPPDISLFDKKDNTHAMKEGIPVVRPVFVVGESKHSSFQSMSKLHSQESNKDYPQMSE